MCERIVEMKLDLTYDMGDEYPLGNLTDIITDIINLKQPYNFLIVVFHQTRLQFVGNVSIMEFRMNCIMRGGH